MTKFESPNEDGDVKPPAPPLNRFLRGYLPLTALSVLAVATLFRLSTSWAATLAGDLVAGIWILQLMITNLLIVAIPSSRRFFWQAAGLAVVSFSLLPLWGVLHGGVQTRTDIGESLREHAGASRSASDEVSCKGSRQQLYFKVSEETVRIDLQAGDELQGLIRHPDHLHASLDGACRDEPLPVSAVMVLASTQDKLAPQRKVLLLEDSTVRPKPGWFGFFDHEKFCVKAEHWTACGSRPPVDGPVPHMATYRLDPERRRCPDGTPFFLRPTEFGGFPRGMLQVTCPYGKASHLWVTHAADVLDPGSKMKDPERIQPDDDLVRLLMKRLLSAV